MEWESVILDEPHTKNSICDQTVTLQSGESAYTVFRKNNQKYLVYVVNITEEKCESIADVQNLVPQSVSAQ